MIKKDVYSSSGKIIGEILFENNVIKVNHFKKPPIIEINDPTIVSIFNSKTVNIDIALKLYNEYNLLMGEIAAIFGVFYSTVNQKLRYLDKAPDKLGRRNSSYNREFSKQQRRLISEGNKNYFKTHKKINYTRTPEIKNKISKGVKKAYEEGRLNAAENSRKGWKLGKFDNVNFKHGIGGYFTSKKIGKRFFFRSLLELYYIINYLEYNNEVKTYTYEPFKIKCSNGTLYTPDFIINDKYVKELKSYNYIYKQGGKIQRNFEYKKIEAEKYCLENDLEYEVIFDKDINFKYDVLLHQLRDLKYIEEFQIEFLEPERVWSQK